jgi:hypothetical protein
MQMLTASCRVAALGLALVLAGCAAPPKTLYQWGDYQGALYQYLRAQGADMGAQIAKLEAQLEKTAATAGTPPPGLHAHLALLYSKAGEDDKALAHLQAERRLFPESATYIDFLLKNAGKPAAKT